MFSLLYMSSLLPRSLSYSFVIIIFYSLIFLFILPTNVGYNSLNIHISSSAFDSVSYVNLAKRNKVHAQNSLRSLTSNQLSILNML